MKLDTIVEEFFETRPELWNEIKAFDQRRGTNLIRKLYSDKDEVNFFSWLNEVRCGLFFDKMCSEMKSEYLIGGKTPDWFISMNQQHMIVEALRLNTSEAQYKESITQSREQRRFQKENPSVPFFTKGPTKIIDLQYLGGKQSKLEEKEEKYRALIQKYQLPFILFVNPSIDTFLFEQDFSDFLMGARGFYKQNESFGKNVTGILLHTAFNQFFYFHNNAAAQPLFEKNLQLLIPYFAG